MNSLRAVATSLTILTASYGLAACGSAEPQPSHCEVIGATLDPSLPNNGYKIDLVLRSIGDNSLNGIVEQVVEADSQDVCERFHNRGTSELKIHDNYDRNALFGTDRKFVCWVRVGGQEVPFAQAKNAIQTNIERTKGLGQALIVRVTGERRKSFTGTDNDGDETYEQRDVCTLAQFPLT